MATTNRCKKCGCEDTFLTSPAPCPTPAGCPTPEPCSETFDSQCIIYTGDDILCNEDTVVPTDSNVASALGKIIDYYCNQITLINGYISVLQNNQGLFDTAFRASLTPTINVNTVAASLVNSNVATGITIIIPVGNIEYQVTDGLAGSQYNTTTGVWTCPQTGKYDINYNVYLTCPDQTGFGWGNTPTTTGAAYSIAVTNPGTVGGTVYCANTYTVVKGVYATRIYLTGGIQGKTLTAGTQLVLRHQNMTGINYTATSGDNIDLAIRRVG
jgi:hypothetical protein